MQVCDCYLQLCNWTEVQQWNADVAELNKKFPSVDGLVPTIDHNYLKVNFQFSFWSLDV